MTVINSGKGQDSKFWCLVQTVIDGIKMHSVIVTIRKMEIDEEIEISQDLHKKLQWMPFAKTKHLSTQRSNVFLPTKFGINTKFKFGLFKGYELGVIYSLDPTYIEWCILNIPFFYISNLEELHQYGIVRLNTNYNYRDLNYAGVIPLIDSFKTIQEITEKIGMANIDFRLSDQAILLNRKKKSEL